MYHMILATLIFYMLATFKSHSPQTAIRNVIPEHCWGSVNNNGLWWGSSLQEDETTHCHPRIQLVSKLVAIDEDRTHRPKV